MKIKTITCHHVYNYGASLQAYALQHYLESLGHEVEIIDFNPWFHCDRYNPFWYPKNGKYAPVFKVLPFLRVLVMPFKAFVNGMFVTWGRKSAFDSFEKKHYHLSRRKYQNSEELKKYAPSADIYIAGSDQIWNTYSENGKEPAYYLGFGSKSVKRISYAASLATNSIMEGFEDFVKRNLLNFNAISVRENTGKNILSRLGITDVEVVLDPVFLLEKEQWDILAQQGKMYGLKEKSYVLVYDFLGNDMKMVDFIKQYSVKHSLQVVSINDFNTRSYADLNINNAGPLEFLALIKNAACVVASSFHATAFSVIFEKEFYTFNLQGFNNSSRMKDLLLSLNIVDRLNPNTESMILDYFKISKILDNLVCNSKMFIKNNIK